jgi:hypothetical protein
MAFIRHWNQVRRVQSRSASAASASQHLPIKAKVQLRHLTGVSHCSVPHAPQKVIDAVDAEVMARLRQLPFTYRASDFALVKPADVYVSARHSLKQGHSGSVSLFECML